MDRVIVVDNASTDDTAAWLAGQGDPRLQVLRLAQNSGGAGGFAAGMAAATELSPAPDWILLLDDDAHPRPGALAQFRRDIAAMGTDLPAVAAAAVYLPDGRIAEMNRPSRNPFWHPTLLLRTLLRGNRAGFHLPDSAFVPTAPVQEIDLASFVGYFVSRAAIARAGLPEAGLFIYGDDVLYSLRLRRAGLSLRFLPAVQFEHDCATMGEGFIYRPLWKIYYHCRNGVAIARAAAGPVVFPAALLWYVVLWARRGQYYTVPEQQLYRKMMWQGIRDGLRGRRGRNDVIHQMAAAPKAPLAEPKRSG